VEISPSKLPFLRVKTIEFINSQQSDDFSRVTLPFFSYTLNLLLEVFHWRPGFACTLTEVETSPDNPKISLIYVYADIPSKKQTGLYLKIVRLLARASKLGSISSTSASS
jgi:hypothetical protein